MLCVLLASLGAAFGALATPPRVRPRLQTLSATAPALPWSPQGQSAVRALGIGVPTARGKLDPIPTATAAKLLTALAVPGQRPLELNQPRPSTIGSADIASCQNDLAPPQGSVAAQATSPVLIRRPGDVPVTVDLGWRSGDHARLRPRTSTPLILKQRRPGPSDRWRYAHLSELNR